MIIELIGPSGAGKTTVVGELDEYDGEEQLKLTGVAELRTLEHEAGWHRLRKCKGVSKIREFLPLYWRHPSISWPLLLLTIVQGRPFRWRSNNRALAALALSLHLGRNCRNWTIVLDEGFIQALWALLIDSKTLRGKWLIRRIIINYQRLVDPINIALAVDPAIAKSRVFARESKGRFNRKSSAEQRCQFDVALDHHRQLVALMPPDMIKATIDSANNRVDVSQRLVRTITGLVGGQDRSCSAKADHRSITLEFTHAQN